MALTMWGQVVIQAATPGEDPVKVGTLWVDISGVPAVKVCTSISPYTFASVSGSGLSDGDYGDITVGGSGTTLTIDPGAVTEAKQTLADNTTNDVTSTKHGYAPKSPADATKFLNGAATPAYALVKDSDLSTSDVVTNDASTTKHGFMPKGGNDATKFYRGDTTQAVPDHGSIGGLTDDDHSQYVAKDGRAGGQTVKGGTGASENLTLSSTANATKGVVTLADEVLSRPELRDHSESKATGTISAGDLTVDYAAAAVFAVSLNAAITSFAISNPSPTGTMCAVTFVFTADGTVRAITWPTGTVWPAGSAPTMTGTLNKRDIITLMTFDAGTTWFGMVVGQNY